MTKLLTNIPVASYDPSLRNWGIAVGNYNTETSEINISSIGVIQPVLDKGKQVRQNSLDVESGLQLFTGAYNASKGCLLVFAEVPVGSQSSRSMCSYGVCTGVLGSLKAMGVPLVEVTPTEVKMASVGSKTATKEEMITWAVGKYPNLNWPKHGKSISAAKAEHMADAIGVLHAGTKTPAFQQFLNIVKNHANQSESN